MMFNFKSISTLAVIYFASSASANINITSPLVTNWGVWGPFQRCPFGRYVQGFQLRTEPNQGFGDDTALNTIRLFCGDPYRPDTPVLTSNEGYYGDWGNVYSCYPGYLNGFQLRVEENQHGGDDTATNNFRATCTNLPPNQWLEGDGLSWGSWGTTQHCYSNQVFCGLQTQVEYDPDPASGDDTMLNNILVECCDYFHKESPAIEKQIVDESARASLNYKVASRT